MQKNYIFLSFIFLLLFGAPAQSDIGNRSEFLCPNVKSVVSDWPTNKWQDFGTEQIRIFVNNKNVNIKTESHEWNLIRSNNEKDSLFANNDRMVLYLRQGDDFRWKISFGIIAADAWAQFGYCNKK